MAERGSILIVEDDDDLSALLQHALTREGFFVECVNNLGAALDSIKRRVYSCILLDLQLGEASSVEAIPTFVRTTPMSLIVVMTAYGTIQKAVDAMAKGAATFIEKGNDLTQFVRQLMAQIDGKGKEWLSQQEAEDFAGCGIVARSPAMRRVLDEITQLKDVDATILIQGESGTGKELTARALHRLSKRAPQVMEAVNCAAIPENLLESELFGVRKGAFTDAKADRMGYFEICREGTLLLDEIGEMPLSLQVKLLRVLQEKEVTPVGATRALKINTRVIAATNRDLAEEVKRGRFREDLFFRLNVFPITLPPLRQRQEDIPLLVESFVNKFNTRYSKAVAPVGRELMARLVGYEWPGNIRELQNAVERALVLTKASELTVEDFEWLFAGKSINTNRASSLDEDELSYREAKEHFEKNYMIKVMAAAKGNIAEAARLSGRYRSDIYRLIERYGLQADSFKA